VVSLKGGAGRVGVFYAACRPVEKPKTVSPQSTTKMKNARAVFSAAEEGDAAEVLRLLASGAAADERPVPGGETPLMRAAARGHETVVRVLLDAGADACARRADGFTPLILAVFFGHEGVVRLLVERGADASARTSLGTTAARWAEARGFASMAGVLRAAEASRPPLLDKVAPARAKAATITSDEVEIFFKARGRRDVGREEEADEAPSPAVDINATHAGVSVRSNGQLPGHPSASTFRLGHFLRSWQGSVGALLLLIAFGVAAFALVQRNNMPRGAAPTATPTAPQAAAQQVPAPLSLTPEPSPAFPTPDPHGVIPVPDQTYVVPNTAGQPYYVSPGPVAPVPSDVPRDLTVVSESGAASPQDSGQAGRRAGANASPTPAARNDARNDNSSDGNAARATRTPEPEAPRPTSQAPPPAAPQPTPTRAKVIQWPPQ
jgi:hypothetical protein